MPKKKDKDYDVGYGKPPQDHQFRKGTSGNPKGRPKKPVDFPAMLARVCGEPVKVKLDDGKYHRIDMSELVIRRIMNQAAKGDQKAMKIWLDLLQQFPVITRGIIQPPSLTVNFISPPDRSEE